ncbi:MAG: hypothetical protein ACYCZX_00900 [Rhodospirillaceae bacterium]
MLTQSVVSPPPEAASDAGESADGGSTTFVFANLVFKAPGARFIGQGTARTPMFSIDLGDTEGLLSISALKRQFKIEPDSPDDRMIALAMRGLNYVADIRPGDNIPNEILTGKASWTIDQRHTEIARKRLEMQLLASVDKKQVTLHDTREITAYLEQTENKAKLRQAFRAAATAMGRPADDHGHVLEQLGAIARELAYIEALREWFLQVGSLNKKVPLVLKAYDSDRRLKGELVQMLALLPPAIKEYRTIFAAVDAESGDIIAALTAIAEKIAVIRDRRDQLHGLTLVWRDIVAEWKGFSREQAPRYLSSAQATYRFLATRHSSGRSMLASMGTKVIASRPINAAR